MRATPGFAARFLRFSCVGGLAFLVDVAVLQLLLWMGAPALVARIVSILSAMVIAWQLNRRFTFGASDRSAAEEGARYAAVATAAATVNYLVFAGLVIWDPALPQWLSAHWPLVAAALSTAVSLWVSFFGFRHFAFNALR